MADQISNLRRIRVTPARARISNATPRITAQNNSFAQSTLVKYPTMISAKSTNDQDDLEFTFPFPPQVISYRDLSPEMSQIARPGKTPIVAFSRYKARQVDIKFLVAVPTDGLFIDVETDLRILQFMASTGRPVWFYNYDKFLGNQFSDAIVGIATFFWTITDLSFESVRRNSAQRIVQASVSMSIVENNNPNVVVAELPKITYGEDPPARSNTQNQNNSAEQNFVEWDEVWEIGNSQAGTTTNQTSPNA